MSQAPVLSPRQPVEAITQIDHPRVRVTELRFPPHSETRWHRHQHDYVIVQMTGGELQLETPDGDKRFPLECGKTYYRDKGNEHNVINDSEQEVVLLEIELLD